MLKLGAVRATACAAPLCTARLSLSPSSPLLLLRGSCSGSGSGVCSGSVPAAPRAGFRTTTQQLGDPAPSAPSSSSQGCGGGGGEHEQQKKFHTPSSSGSGRRSLVTTLALVVMGGGGAIVLYCYYYYDLATAFAQQQAAVLNPDTFVPYTNTSRDAISADSFIMTVEPQHQDASSSSSRYPLWSVEFKQPELQIARHYTPLPPTLLAEEEEDDDDDDDDDDEAGQVGQVKKQNKKKKIKAKKHSQQQQQQLRFYVRLVPGGEMSSYLGRLGVGRTVWLRGPHPGFDVEARLGGREGKRRRRRHVVFLAGGTGVVPAMQMARAVLDADDASSSSSSRRQDTRFTLLWAVRSRQELQKKTTDNEEKRRRNTSSWWDLFRTRKQPLQLQDEVTGERMVGASAIGGELAAMKTRYGERLQIRVGIDEENSQFSASDVAAAVMEGGEKEEEEEEEEGRWRQRVDDDGCRAHNQDLHALASELEPTGSCTCRCRCRCRDGGDEEAGTGKKLLVVSGPEGFVARYAGNKVWRDGAERQGPVGGVAGELRRREGRFAAEWLVLKL